MPNKGRRRFLTALSLSLGAAVSPLGLRALEAAPFFDSNGSTKLLTSPQLALVADMVDIIIPATDTPGAKQAKVHVFIDSMLAQFLPKSQQQQWLADLNAFDKKHRGFSSLSAKQQLSILTELDDNLGRDDFYQQLKELTVIGYYTSEIGASVELQYDPVPGPYREMPLSQVGRAWS